MPEQPQSTTRQNAPVQPRRSAGEHPAAVDVDMSSEPITGVIEAPVPQPPPRRRTKEELRREKNLLRPFDVVERYQILKVLGAGGMAEVYLARAMLGEGVDKLVALKTVLPEFGPDTKYGALFLQEARVSATLRHPNMIQVFGFGEAAGRAYLAMEYIHGRDLAAALARHRMQHQPVPAELAVSVAIELCRALEYVHERKDLDGRPLKLVHRDVSPGNVLLTQDSDVKLMDFGVAAAAGGSGNPNLLVGKFPYMALAQACGGEPAPLWDLFAVGVLLYELLTLRRPYPNVPVNEFVAMRKKAEFPKPSQLNPSIPPMLDDLVTRACTELITFQSATAFRKTLERVQLQIGKGDVGAWMKELFAPELAEEQQQIEALTREARSRSGFHSPTVSSPMMKKVHAVRRKVASSRAWIGLAQRRWLRGGLAAAMVAGCLLGGSASMKSARQEKEFVSHLNAAEAQAVAGRLVGPTGTEMLGELLEAKKLKPEDPRVCTRLKLLADKFVSLGEVAMSRGNREEAAAHFEAALKADEGRPGIKEKLQQIEEEIIQESKTRIVRATEGG